MCYMRGFAEEIVPGFVGAFAGCRFKYPDFGFRDLESWNVSAIDIKSLNEIARTDN
jgi:hypothetical protein